MNNPQKSINALSSTLSKQIKALSQAVEDGRKMFRTQDDEFTERGNVTDRRLEITIRRLELVERFLALPWYRRIFHNLPAELKLEFQREPKK